MTAPANKNKKLEALIIFEELSFAWVNRQDNSDKGPLQVEDLSLVWQDLNLELPAGMVSILGENGIGKSTLLLLAAGRLFPQKGQVTLLSTDTKQFVDASVNPQSELERMRLASFVYQNMEFETELPFKDLLRQVYQNGFWPQRASNYDHQKLVAGLPEAFDLQSSMEQRLQDMAKGQLQRAIVAMALCYGSQLVIMDEPVFALEEVHKNKVFEFVRAFAASSGTSIYYTAHDFDLCKNYADYTLLINKDKTINLGLSSKVCQRDLIEQAYQAPMDTLYRKESLYREMLVNGRRQS